MRFAEIRGTTLRYRVTGDPRGPAVIFANSLGTDLTIWDEVACRLPGGYALIGYDKRGHGLSGLPDGPMTIEEHADDLLALADHLGVGTFVLCGVSVGGMIAQAVAAKAAERVRGLVLCNTGARIGPPEIWAERIAAIEANGLEALADAVMDRWFTPAFHQAEPESLAGYRAMLTRMPARGYTATCAAIRDADLTATTANISLPALCIAGADDLATPPSLVQALAGSIEGSDYLEIADCGHIPSVQQPEICAQAIAQFLSDLEGRQAPGSSLSLNYAKGMEVRRRVLGDAHVERATAKATALDRRFQTFITEGAWGSVWSGRHFSLRERSIVTLALLAAQGQDEELAMHLRATANTGASQKDVAEALMHVAVYAGVPRANHALKIARQIFSETSSAETSEES